MVEYKLPTDSDNEVYIAVYDMRALIQLNAGLGILTTFMVCFVLGFGALFFKWMATDLVINPIQKMT